VTSVLVRHASAGRGRDFAGDDDSQRHLDARGRLQAAALVELFGPLGVRRVLSSPYVRCVETVEPLAAALGLPVEIEERLAEGAGGAAEDLLHEDGAVCCTHGDVAEELLGHGLKMAAAAIFDDGKVVREIPPPPS
jgi:8-oxo-dGTP diphosphatase